MKHLLKWAVVLMVAVVFTGCENVFEASSDEDKDVTFVNKSTYTVTVIPQAQSGWAGFSIPPGERVKLNDPDDVYFTYEPRYRVTVGDDTDGRILFINLKEGTVSVE